MIVSTNIILAVFGVLWLLAFGGFGWVSYTEGEPRATRVALMVALGRAVIFFLAAALPKSVQWGLLGVVILVGTGGLILFFLPIGKITIGNDIPYQRFDERRILFARARLQPDSLEFERYYAQHPEDRASDDRFRALSGLLSPQAKFANIYHFAAIDGSFGLTHALWEAVDGPMADQQQSLLAEEMTRYIEGLARYFGALDVGVTELQPITYTRMWGVEPGSTANLSRSSIPMPSPSRWR
jgi:hypothetical protein